MRPYEVLEALWGLVGEGLVYLDSRGQSSPDNWAWRLSAQGITVAGGGAWQPRDPEGYLRRLERHRPAVNALTVEYVAEALRAFNARAFLAASVMVGVASERAVLDVAYTLVAVRGDNARKLREALTRNGASQLQRFTELRRALEPLKPHLGGMVDTLTFDAIADLLRVARNEAGHPTGEQVDEDTAAAHLYVAGRYLQRLASLQTFLGENPKRFV